MAAVAISRVAAERGDVDLPRPFGPENRDDAKRRADWQRPRFAKNLADAIGHGVGRDVVVLRQMTHQLVAHAAASPQRLMAAVAEAANDLLGKFAGKLGIDGGHGAGG